MLGFDCTPHIKPLPDSTLIYGTFVSKQLIEKGSEMWGNPLYTKWPIMPEEAIYTLVKEKLKQELKKKSLSDTTAATNKSSFSHTTLEQWFSTGGDFAPQQPFPETCLVVTTRGQWLASCARGRCDWHLMGRGHGHCSTILRDSPPQQRQIWPKISIVLRLRILILESWKANHMKYDCVLEVGLFRREKCVNTKVLTQWVSAYRSRM